MPPKKKQTKLNNAAVRSVTNYAEIQQNEVEALRSIFMDDFEEVKTKSAAWNVSRCTRSMNNYKC